MKLYLKTISLILLFFTEIYAQNPKVSAQTKPMEVFVLMGQSNMAGFAFLLPEDSNAVENVFKIPTILKGELAWQPAAHPLHNRLGSDRFGLGLPFAKAYMKKKKRTPIGLIPVARGGAPIDILNKGSEIYADALKKISFAQQNGAIIKGILWHQGESDTVTDTLANTYEAKLIKLIADIRADVGDPNLPFVVGNLTEFYGTHPDHNKDGRAIRIEKVRQILRSIPNKVPNTAFVESSECASPDSYDVHFDRNSYILLGKRYAKEVLKIQKKLK